MCLGLMQYSTNIVFERLDVGLSLALFQLSSIVAILFGYKVFKESNIVKKLIGAIIMIVGSCLILL
jgi:drug/metabolite transporter (DMT)-like permease